MDKAFEDVEELRARLKAVPYTLFVQLADAAKVKRSTAQKFRTGETAEIGSHKLAALVSALNAHENPTGKWDGKERRKQPRTKSPV